MPKWKRKLWARGGGVQRKLAEHRSWGLVKSKSKLQKEIELTLQQEELIWYQKSWEDWIASGDRNTKFYHASTLVRRSRNKIESLKDAIDNLITDPHRLVMMVQSLQIAIQRIRYGL